MSLILGLKIRKEFNLNNSNHISEVFMAGIVGYGAHLPRHRIKVEEIAKVWGADAPSYKKGLMLREKSVPCRSRRPRTRSSVPVASIR